MEIKIDVDQWVLTAATISMDWNGNVIDKAALIMAFDALHPEVKLVQRLRKQVKEYKKLTQWR